MGATESVIRRVAFDAATVVSALLFPNGRLAWLREVAELTRVLRCPKFKLSEDDGRELLGDYVRYCE